MTMVSNKKYLLLSRGDTHPMESNVADIVIGYNPRVLARRDAPGFSHPGRIRVSDISSVDVGY